jgi:hypothetical protein
LEGHQLKLSTENFPISCSLRPQFEEAIEKEARRNNEHVMPLQDLVAYLKTPHDLDLPPYVDLLHQTEVMGDPSVPGPEHSVILRWISEALLKYEQRFPAEEPLASSIRRIKPLAAAMALVDPDFLQPDVHPLHQLLDVMQERAVGWHASLGRAGDNLRKQVDTAIEGALQWFDDQTIDLAPICAEFMDAAERDRSRAVRMSQRVVATELGRIKTVAVKKEAANMINNSLAEYEVPREICEFLKGPWYDSAQLVLHKFSAESQQWERMAKTTTTLLDSIQSLEDANEERRQYIYSVATELPKEMRRWLLSLHHDTAAVNDVMQKVEFAQLRVLKNEQLECVKADPISVNDPFGAGGNDNLASALNILEEGQWLEIETLTEGTIRAQLALKNEQEQRLIFTNMAGIKAAEYSFVKFDQLMSLKRVTALPSGSGFSLCLAAAAGISTTEQLDALYSLVTAKIPPREQSTGQNDVSCGLSADEGGSTGEPEDLASYLAGALEGTTPENALLETGDFNEDDDLAILLAGPEELDTANLDSTNDTEDTGVEDTATPDDIVVAEDNTSVIEDGDARNETITSLANSDKGTEGPIDAEITTAGGIETEAEASIAKDDSVTEGNQTLAEQASMLDGSWKQKLPDDQVDNQPETGHLAELDSHDSGNTPAADEIMAEGQESHKPLDLSEASNLEELFTEDFLSEDEMRGLQSLIAEDELSRSSRSESYFAPEIDTESAFMLEEEDFTSPFSDDDGELDLSTPIPESATDKVENGIDNDAINFPEATVGSGANSIEMNAKAEIVPMGTWIGFHDSESPLMARLAVHDPESDHYIFVNRAGKKMREMSGITLVALLENGQADILNIN